MKGNPFTPCTIPSLEIKGSPFTVSPEMERKPVNSIYKNEKIAVVERDSTCRSHCI